MREYLKIYALALLFWLINPIQTLIILLCMGISFIGEKLEDVGWFIYDNLMIAKKLKYRLDRDYAKLMIRKGKWVD